MFEHRSSAGHRSRLHRRGCGHRSNQQLSTKTRIRFGGITTRSTSYPNAKPAVLTAISTWRRSTGATFYAPRGFQVGDQGLHSRYEELRPVLSPDGLTLYFGSKRYGIGNDTNGDIWMARRTPTDPPFQQPINLWGMNNTGIDFPVTVSADGCTLYFASNEETGLGDSQNFRLYQATRGTSTPAQVTLRLNILGQGSVTQPPFNCGPGNTGTCSASAPPDTTWVVNGERPSALDRVLRRQRRPTEHGRCRRLLAECGLHHQVPGRPSRRPGRALLVVDGLRSRGSVREQHVWQLSGAVTCRHFHTLRGPGVGTLNEARERFQE